MSKLKITQTRGLVKKPKRQRRTMAALGLRRIRQSVVKEDTPQLRGMIERVQHLVNVEEVE